MAHATAGSRKRQSFWLAMPLLVGTALSAAEDPPRATVVFVCEHGSVKSVIASEWFNRLARERKLPFRSISRGVTPDRTIPPLVEQNLGKDGFDVAGFVPTRLDGRELGEGTHLVTIGVEPASLGDIRQAPSETWADIPPASTEYSASRDAMRERIEAFLGKLAREPRSPQD